ncbi:MAG: glycine dehydrogenase subunit 1 [Spirochaetes bacterium]|nr:MAG: glycine dehydrogenase subunit 1 [Spirochaetota bacterium]
MPFIPNADSDRLEMLASIGVSKVEELFSDIPSAKRFPPLDLPKGISEFEMLSEIEALAAKNLGAKGKAWFMGAGAYNHFIPSIVPALASRGEFLTAYTPYQPEVSQGTLQAIFEYQSMAAALLGVDVVNASHYDVATALAEAILMAWKQNEDRPAVYFPSDLHPEYRGVVETYVSSFPIELRFYEGDPAALAIDERVACVVAGYPSFSGEVYSLGTCAEKTHAAGALLIVQADPHVCALLESPGAQGADIVVAEGQSLGNPMNFGGPYLGMMGASEKLMRKLPGRIVGEAKDREGRKGYVLTLTAREQHIRREKAVSNICSNQGLSRLCYDKAHFAAERIAQIPGYKIETRRFFKEFLVSTPIAAEAIFDRLLKKDIVPGFPLSRYDASKDNKLLCCVTELNSKEEIDALVKALAEVTP